jgi:hypothetical protein
MKIVLKFWVISGLIAALILAGTAVTTANAAGSFQEDETNPFCEDSDSVHPVGAAIAETYDMSYDQIMAWFCGVEASEDDAAPYHSHGLGQVMLALQTAENNGNPEEAHHYLEQRQEGKGWGQIWQEAGLIGKNRAKEQGKPDHAGPPEDKGKPDHAGPPEDKGKPDHAGPKDKPKNK